MRCLRLAGLALLLMACSRVADLKAGKYQVADQEYSSQNYNMERTFAADGSLEERHVLDRCLVMEMSGTWAQKRGALTLTYTRAHNRSSCRDSLPEWSPDSAKLDIPIRNVDGVGFESLLAASDGKPEKWLKWIKLD